MRTGSNRIPYDESTPLRAVGLRFDRNRLIVLLDDQREVSVPLSKYPSLLHASPSQRRAWEIIGQGDGFHWEALNLDLSTLGLVNGYPEAIPKPPDLAGIVAPKIARRRSA
jgi:hypothetical protein